LKRSEIHRVNDAPAQFHHAPENLIANARDILFLVKMRQVATFSTVPRRASAMFYWHRYY
jgi:hypothetical protein